MAGPLERALCCRRRIPKPALAVEVNAMNEITPLQERITSDTLACAEFARKFFGDRPFTVFPGRMTDAGYSHPIAIPAPEGWVPRGYHVTTCADCGEVTEPYSETDARIVHRATGWVMC